MAWKRLRNPIGGGTNAPGVALTERETVVANVHPTWRHWNTEVGVALLVLVGGLALRDVSPLLPIGGGLVAVALLGYVAIARKRRRYVVTDQRVIKRVGLLGKRTSEISRDAISLIETRISLRDRVIHRGTVVVKGRARDEQLELEGIADPDAFANSIREIDGAD